MSAHEPLAVEAFLERLKAAVRDDLHHQVVHIASLPEQEAQYAVPAPPLPASLQRALNALGVARLYSHQVEALQRARRGENVVVVTATSSGKTLCYNLPVLEGILRNRQATALYLYPINALINDQLRSLARMDLALRQDAVGIGRYTGALRAEERKALRARQPNIILTNPEMLHLSFLQWHPQWERFWRNLRYVVVDEVHTYRGVFGANMAHVFQRLQRVAAHYGARPQFICCSATIANPQELAETLTGLPFAVVDRDGAGRGRKQFVLWNPPVEPSGGDNVRRSYAQEAVNLMRHCLRAGYQTIVFARARSMTERMLRLSQTLGDDDGFLAGRISSYRAGYLAEEREEIENALKTGELRGIITTNALEMGIDIGGLDAAIIAGYPGTIMSAWQQAGRAGRRGRDALVFLVASQNPLDQYYMSHPQAFFEQPHELAVVDVHNPHIALKHLLCAARELPLWPSEVSRLPQVWQSAIEPLQQRGLLERASADCHVFAYPKERREVHMQMSLRSAGHETYRIVDQAGHEIGTIEPPHVFREAHPGAIYQHRGEDYRVVALDRQAHLVRVREESSHLYTRSISTTGLHVEEALSRRPVRLGGLPFEVALGRVQVYETVRSYQEMEPGSERLVRRVNLTIPLSTRLDTMAMWIAIPGGPQTAWISSLPLSEDVADREMALAAGLHALEHLLTGVMPLLVMCDRSDIDGAHHTHHPDLDAPALFVYDVYEGGIGLAEIACRQAERLLGLALATVASCPCVAGCPSCIQSSACRLRNEALSKAAARAILRALLGQAAPHPAGEMPGALSSARPGAVSSPSPEVLRAVEELDRRTQRRGLMRETTPPDRNAQPSQDALQATHPPVTARFSPGEPVRHVVYGQGVVVASALRDGHEIVTVRFGRRGLLREMDAADSGLRK